MASLDSLSVTLIPCGAREDAWIYRSHPERMALPGTGLL